MKWAAISPRRSGHVPAELAARPERAQSRLEGQFPFITNLQNTYSIRGARHEYIYLYSLDQHFGGQTCRKISPKPCRRQHRCPPGSSKVSFSLRTAPARCPFEKLTCITPPPKKKTSRHSIQTTRPRCSKLPRKSATSSRKPRSTSTLFSPSHSSRITAAPPFTGGQAKPKKKKKTCPLLSCHVCLGESHRFGNSPFFLFHRSFSDSPPMK